MSALEHPGIPAPPSPEVAYRAVSDLRRARRTRRLAGASWGDLAYRAYTTALATLVAVVFLSGVVGDDVLGPAAIDQLVADGPAWAGVIVALVVLAGVRSGARGGPLAVEAPDVQHLLLGPADRTHVLRRPTIGLLGYGIATGAAVGGLAGSLVDQRVGGAAAPWVGSGAVLGAATTALALGLALLTSSRVLPRVPIVLAAWALLAWSVAVAAGAPVPDAPTTLLGGVAVWPLELDPLSIIPVVVAPAIAIAGAWAVGGISVDAARRRTALVGQLRFAVTQQDLRTVVLLRRQLAAEIPRRRPWFGALPRPLARRFPVLARDLRSIARWPVVRLVRVIVFGAAAGLALRGMWAGTTPLVVVAGIALYVAALDAAEPLAQDVDHPLLLASNPMPDGAVLVRHLAQPVLVMIGVGLVAIAAATAVDPDPTVWRVGAVALLPGAAAAVAGAAITVVSDVPTVGDAAMATPEVAGPRLLFRTVWPPLVAVLGTVPVLAARGASSAEGAGSSAPLAACAVAAVPVLALCAAVAGWVRHREAIHRAMAEATGGSTS